MASRNFGTATTAAPKLNLLNIEEQLKQAHLRLNRAYIENLDWQACIKKYDRPHTLFYLDPPYWQSTGYGVDFAFDQYEAIARYFESVQGRIILSINDQPDIRDLFKDFVTKDVKLQYCLANNGVRKTSTELIISSRRISDPQDAWSQTPGMPVRDYTSNQINLEF